MNDTEYFIEKLKKGYQVESFHIKGNEIIFKLKSNDDEVDGNDEVGSGVDRISDYIKKLGNYQTHIDGVKYDIQFDFNGSDIFNTNSSYYDSLYDMMNSWSNLLGIDMTNNFNHESSVKIDNNIMKLFEKYPNIIDDDAKVEVYNNLLKTNHDAENFENCIILRDLINQIKKRES